jgi:hypothetical protein
MPKKEVVGSLRSGAKWEVVRSEIITVLWDTSQTGMKEQVAQASMSPWDHSHEGCCHDGNHH